MTLKHLRIFVTVYQEMNITKAADLLHMTQPAVSRSIQELENYYGIRLFERINRRLYRTKESEEARKAAAETMAEVKRAMRINYFEDAALIQEQSERFAAKHEK